VGVYDVTWKLLQDASKSDSAFVDVVKFMDTGLQRHFLRMLNADLISDGLGKLYKFPAADDAAEHTAENVPLVDLNMIVDVMDATDNNTKLGNSLTVSAYDLTTKSVTLSGAPSGTAAGDYAVIQDTVATSTSYHSHGLLGVASNADPPAPKGDYGGIDRTAAGTEYWESTVLANGGTNRALTEDLGLQALDNARLKGGGKINVVLSNQAIVRRYHELMATSIDRFRSTGTISGGIGRKNSGTVKADDTGRSVYDFGGIPWHVEPYFEANTILMLDTSTLWIGHGENSVPQPISEIFPKAPFFYQTTNTTFQVNWYYQMELLCDNPAALVQIQDIAES
jgi:hypothetical protein